MAAAEEEEFTPAVAFDDGSGAILRVLEQEDTVENRKLAWKWLKEKMVLGDIAIAAEEILKIKAEGELAIRKLGVFAGGGALNVFSRGLILEYFGALIDRIEAFLKEYQAFKAKHGDFESKKVLKGLLRERYFASQYTTLHERIRVRGLQLEESRKKLQAIKSMKKLVSRQVEMLDTQLTNMLRFYSAEERLTDARMDRYRDHKLRLSVQEARLDIAERRLGDEEKRKKNELELMDKLRELKKVHGEHGKIIGLVERQRAAIRSLTDLIGASKLADTEGPLVLRAPTTFKLSEIEKRLAESILPRLGAISGRVEDGGSRWSHYSGFQRDMFGLLEMSAAEMAVKLSRLRVAVDARRPVPPSRNQTADRCIPFVERAGWREVCAGADVQCADVSDVVSEIGGRGGGMVVVHCCEFHSPEVSRVFAEAIEQETFSDEGKRRHWIFRLRVRATIV